MITANRKEGYELLQDCSLTLAVIEMNGIRIDTARLQRTEEKLTKKIRELKLELEQSETWKLWRKRFGAGSNMTSHAQLAVILFDVLKFESKNKTATGKAKTDEAALQDIDDPFVQKLLRWTKYEKALNTFLKGIKSEVVGDRLHPIFNLHTARSFRSSSDSPNFQNFPVRDKTISKIIRSLFIASPDCVLVENDFKGIEVSISAAYHKDPVFISYITTPGKDMHRDMAAQIYKLKPSEVSKEIRYGAKNKFVFPQFYGDYYISCAQSLWDWITRGKLTTPDGTPLMKHLRAQGITELGACDPEDSPRAGTFEAHVQEVEKDFWNNRFRRYGQWRKEWYQAYLDKGYFDMFTGFRIKGHYPRNAVVNYCVQGSAAHCLFWCLTRIQHALVKYRMKSKLVGQIHDSLLGDVRERELRDYLEIVERVAIHDLREHYKDWLIVPLEIEYEISPPGGSWHDKREFKFSKGRFIHPDDPKKQTDDAAKFLKTL